MIFFSLSLRYHHDSLSKAYEYLLQRRHIAAPNMSFFLQLLRYEKELRTSKDIDESQRNDDQTNPIQTLDAKQDPAVCDQPVDENLKVK